MNLPSSLAKKSEKGFTIVELLIVIVVIGILAAIVIVAFNGVQSRANTTARVSAAETVSKKIEAFNSINSAYPGRPGGTSPVIASLTTQLATAAESSLSNTSITIGTPTSSTDNNTVQVRLCSNSATAPVAGATATGYAIYIWDTTLTTAGLNAVAAGGTTSITNGTGGAANTVNGAGTNGAGCVAV